MCGVESQCNISVLLAPARDFVDHSCPQSFCASLAFLARESVFGISFLGAGFDFDAGTFDIVNAAID